MAIVTATAPVQRILTHMDEPAEPPAHRPRDDLLEPLPDWDALAQPAPEFELDQRIAW